MFNNAGDNRIPLWDELRGSAIVCMVFAHFLYVDTRRYYRFDPSQVWSNFASVCDILWAGANMVFSYMAPFLFLFIVGIMANLKFSRQRKPMIGPAARRFFKLYFANSVIGAILLFHTGSLHVAVSKPWLLFTSFGGILMTIAFVYLVFEFILLLFFDYFRQPLFLKLVVITAVAMAVLLFDLLAKGAYPTYHHLPLAGKVASGLVMALLGDLFVTVYPLLEHRPGRYFGYLFILPAFLSLVFIVLAPPELGAIKRMHISYFCFCFSLSALLVYLLRLPAKKLWLQWTKKMLARMGVYSLTLYICHFFFGYVFEKLVLKRFVPPGFWCINTVVVLLCCVLLSVFFDFANKRRAMVSESVR